ncbi:MAG: hypothetical protein ACYTGO_18235 [Planctomycetota bacterium]
MIGQQSAQTQGEIRGVPELTLELMALRADQVKADVGVGLATEQRGVGSTDGRLRNLKLCSAGPLRQPLDNVAVLVTGLEIHACIDTRGIAGEHTLDQARAAEEGLPPNIVDGVKLPDGLDEILDIADSPRHSGPCTRGEWARDLAEHVAQIFDDVLDAAEAEHDRKRPEFTNGER